MGCDRQHRRTTAVSVEQAIDEMKIARTAGTRADRKTAGDLRFTRGRKGCDLLVTNVNPVNCTSFAHRLGQAVEAVTDHPEDTFHPCLN